MTEEDLKLFIPGPTHVRAEILAELARPVISHRGAAIRELIAACLPGVRAAFGTKGPVVLLSSSSTGAMEAVSRSVTRPGRRVLHLVNGNFSNLWRKLSTACGLDVAVVEREWGDAFDEDAAAAALDEHGPVDAVFVAHSETSTGALSDVAGIARAVRARDDVLLCVDVTSSACGVRLDFDSNDVDVAVGGVQKCWALPPALALAAVSERALARMNEVPGRGYTNDIPSALAIQDDRGMTATTPAIPQLRALARQIRDIEAAGGMEARFERHLAMQRLVLDWAERRGLGVMAKPGFRSPSVTSIACDGRFEIADLVAGYREHGYFIGAGYGKSKTTHWRIGHMGDHTPDDVAQVLAITDTILDRIDAGARAGA